MVPNKKAMKQVNLFFYLCLTAIIMVSCSSDERAIPNSVGKSSEMLIVIEKHNWNGSAGEEIRSFFGQEMEGLPQVEPSFKLTWIPESEFATIMQSHRNIFIASIKPDIIKPFIETKRDLWAKPQRVIKINASSDTAFIRIFKENQNAVLKLFEQAERERIQKAYKSVLNQSVVKEISDNFGFTLIIPSGYYTAKNQSGFMWIRRETAEISQAILIYSYDYKDTVDFNPGHILAMRDIITKQHVPGTFDGTYMKVENEFMPPVSERIDFNGRFGVETRGLWKVKGDYMGGPFVNYSIVDETGTKILSLDAYVYAPNEKKRDLIRQLEAILYSYEPELK